MIHSDLLLKIALLTKATDTTGVDIKGDVIEFINDGAMGYTFSADEVEKMEHSELAEILMGLRD